MTDDHSHVGIRTALKERQRYAASVLGKIGVNYPVLSQGKIDLSAAAAEKILPAIEDELASKEKWLDTRDAAITRSPNSEAIKARLPPNY